MVRTPPRPAKRDTMAVFKVEGGHRLHGSITPQGAKNEALQILCATLLTPERVTVHNIPQILDVMQLIELLRAMGVEVDRLSDDTYSFRARRSTSTTCARTTTAAAARACAAR